MNSDVELTAIVPVIVVLPAPSVLVTDSVPVTFELPVICAPFALTVRPVPAVTVVPTKSAPPIPVPPATINAPDPEFELGAELTMFRGLLSLRTSMSWLEVYAYIAYILIVGYFFLKPSKTTSVEQPKVKVS